MSVLTGNMDNVEKYSIRSEIGEKYPKTKDESESEINGHIRIVADLEQITVVKNDYESDNVTSRDSDSGQILRIKTENETQQAASQTYANQGVYPNKLSIKNEHKQNEYPEAGNCSAASEFPTKCQNCEFCFTEYLQYLDHQSLCVARKDNGDTFEVKIETDQIPELYSDNMLQSGEHLKGHATLPELKREVNETSYENDKTTMTTDQDDTINHHNIPRQPIPQLLIQNTASCTDTLPTEKQSQEIPITCFYCNEAFLHMERLSYIQYNDILSDIKHMDRSSYIQHVQKHLDKMNKVNENTRFDAMHEVKSLNDQLRNLFKVEVTATQCKTRSCNYIFVDNSACLKHELMTHSSAELTSHIICGHPVTAKPFENLHSHGTVNEVTKGENEVISTKIKKSKQCSQTNCIAFENVKYHCFTEISQKQESCETSFVDSSTFRDRDLSKRSQKTGIQLGKDFSMNSVQKHSTATDGNEKGTDSIRKTYVFKDKNENDNNLIQQQNLMFETPFNRSNENEEISTGKDSHTKGIYRYPCKLDNCQLVFETYEKSIEHLHKQPHSKVYRCMAKGCKMVFDTSDERRKHVQEQHISISFNPSQYELKYTTPVMYKATNRNKKLLKHISNYSNEGIKKSKSTSSDSRKSVTGKPCPKTEAESKESYTTFENTCGVTDDGIKPISKFDEHIKGKFSNYNSCQRLKLKQLSAISSNEKRKSGVLVYEFEDINDSNKKVKQLEGLMRDEQRDEQKVECDGKNEEISAGKYYVTYKFSCNFRGCHLLFNTYNEKMIHVIEQHMKPSSERPEFPCMHNGCKMVFDTLKERRKHVHKQHITSNISPIRFECPTPGCTKGFDRILDLKEHSRNCSNTFIIKSKSHVSK